MREQKTLTIVWGVIGLHAELDTEIAMNWIDVNESLPQVGIDSVYSSTWVLVSYVFDGKHYNTLGKYIKTPAPYWIDVHRDKLEKITHWMQLPEPPMIGV